ncbi:MAG: glutamine-hydrolyzing GMP synthase [Candidatus Latescibacterota bacterium]|nr:glutamine-hydrolyzing GMP synthase [Candidatus Latescibacterota bacterium]
MARGIVVLDFGGQYAHLIANRIRRLHVYAEIRSPESSPDSLQDADGLIFSGGPSSVYADDRPTFNEAILDSGKPILGLCYGHQLLCHHLGGQVEAGERMEFGAAILNVAVARSIFAGLKTQERVWMSHRDLVREIPKGFELLASTEDCPVAAMGDDGRRIYGLQFHPEVTQTESGMEILDNFLTLCGAERSWTMENFIDESIEKLRRHIGDRKVFLLVSGGVDSTVSYLLLNRALGEERVLGLHIDNGFMREGETTTVHQLMTESGFESLKVVDASAEFLGQVKGITDPEEKRKRIGEEFVQVRERVLAELDLDPDEWLLGQGTLYTDTIESGGTDHAEVIKTHHNRVGVIEQLLAEGKVIEPLNQLYKDEVREVGKKLGLPHYLVWRHPFPGPGLAVRCLCSDGNGNGEVDGSRNSPVGEQELASTHDESGFAVNVLPLKSVGVQGDGRTYAHPALVTLGVQRLAMVPGAEESDVTWDELEQVSTDLTNEFPGINRVVFQLGPDRALDQTVKVGYLTRDRIDLLRQADSIVMGALERYDLMGQVTQMPTVLVPLSSDGESESIVLRPITTDDFMTARFDRLPADFLREVTDSLLDLDGVEAVYYDITHKPPGTVEWE